MTKTIIMIKMKPPAAPAATGTILKAVVVGVPVVGMEVEEVMRVEDVIGAVVDVDEGAGMTGIVDTVDTVDTVPAVVVIVSIMR